MKPLYLLFIFLISWTCFSQKLSSSIGFIENKGQVEDQYGKPNPAVKYLLNTNGLNVQLRANGFSYDVYEVKKETEGDRQNNKNLEFLNYSLKYTFHRIDIDFIGSNSEAKLVAENKSLDYDNYYNVVSKPEGILDVHTFQKVTYVDVYPNIDVVFFVPEDKSKPVEYNFIVKPNGRITDIQLRINGAKTKLDNNKIKIATRFGVMEETLPLSWIQNDKKEVQIAYKKISKNVYGFHTVENFNNKTVIIDPVPIRLWGTYFNDDNAYNSSISIANDNLSNVYFGGGTSLATNIATIGSHQSIKSNFTDGYLVKFDINGNRLWGTYYGGTGPEGIQAMAQKNGVLLVTGATRSPSNIATPGAFKENLSIGTNTFTTLDCFIVKFNLAGQRIWGTYFGGESGDFPLNIEIENVSGNFVLVGGSYSINDIATPGTFKDFKDQPINLNTVAEGYISKFDPNGHPIWGSFYGLCEVRGVGIDSFGNIYFSGDVGHSNPYIATAGTYQPIFSYNIFLGTSDYDSYLAKFTPNGQRVWGTYYGGYGNEYNNCLRVDSNNDVLISGYTTSDTLIATAGSYQTALNGGSGNGISDAYLAKFNPNGQIIWSTYYGGERDEDDSTYTIDIDETNNIFLTGVTPSNNRIATPGAMSDTRIGNSDGFIAKFTPQGSRLWGTYFGGIGSDYPNKIKYDKNGIFYVAGSSYSSDWIATPGAFQQVMNGGPANQFFEQFKDCQSVAQASGTNACIGGTINLTASGGTGYTWTGPNGFTSNQQNPTINNVNASHSGLYSCAITGSAGCDNTISFNVVVGDVTKPVPDVASLPTINGDCNTVVSIPTATDNCAGSINGITTSPLSYPLPGNYTITWTYNDGNGNSETQTQNVIIIAVSLPTAVSPQKFCIQQNATLNDILITGTNIKWYDAATNGNLLANTTILQNGTYYASQTITGCESLRVAVLIQIQNTAAPTGTNQSFCATQNATLNDVVVTGTDIKWYANASSVSELPATAILADNTTYYATQTLNGCESVTRLPILITLIYTLNAINYATTVCDEGNNGAENVTLSDYDSFLISTITGNTFTYYNSNNGAENQIATEQFTASHSLVTGLNTVYVRIDSSNGCHQVVELQLTLVNEPIVTIPNEVVLCEGKIVSVDAGAGFDSYTWSNGANTRTILIAQAGNYSVTVTENHGAVVCSYTKNFTVILSNPAVITSIDVVDWTDNQNSITINLSVDSLGDYEYSIDGEHFQDSNVFHDLPNGYYTVTIRDKKHCGITTKEVFLLNYPKFFTPNGDSNNDNWYIKFSQFEPNFTVRIFDRYGKLLKAMNNVGFWDGTFNGKLMPSDDYWFFVTREDGKIHKGHFSLIR